MAYRTKKELIEAGYTAGEYTDSIMYKHITNSDLYEEIVLFHYTKKGTVQRIIGKERMRTYKELADLLLDITKGYYPCDRRAKKELLELLGFQHTTLSEQ